MSATRLVLYQGSAFTIEWFYDERGRSLAREFFLALPDSRKAAFLALARRLGDAGVFEMKQSFATREIRFLLSSLNRNGISVSFLPVAK